MDKLLSNIKNIPGVIGVSIFNDDGGLVVFDFPDAYDKNLINLLGIKFHPIRDLLADTEGEIVYLCWEFEDLLLFYCPVSGGWVNIISTDSISMPVFSLTMTAVNSKLPGLLGGADQPREQLPGKNAESMVPPETFAELDGILSGFLGPASTLLLERAALRQGFTINNIPRDSFKFILDDMMEKVPDKDKNQAGERLKKFY